MCVWFHDYFLIYSCSSIEIKERIKDPFQAASSEYLLGEKLYRTFILYFKGFTFNYKT